MTEYATVAQAARRLGISRSAVHRRLKSGELTGRQEPRPQGHIWLIALPEGTGTSRQVPGATDTSRQVPIDGVQEPPPPPETALLARRALDMAQYSNALLEPYVRRIEEQAEELGRVKAELEQARAQLSERAEAGSTNGQTHDGAAPEVGRRPWWQRLWG